MSNMIVVAFKNETGADEMRNKLVDLQKQQLITVEDAAVVVRKGDGKPKIKQAVDLVGQGALGGAFWGMFLGLLFFAPWLGLAMGAGMGALAGKASDYGVDDNFIKEAGDKIEPGHSAIFMLVKDATPDKVIAELKPLGGEIVHTSLSQEDEDKLKEAFSAKS